MRLLEDFLEACDPSLDEAVYSKPRQFESNADRIKYILETSDVDANFMLDELLDFLPDEALDGFASVDFSYDSSDIDYLESLNEDISARPNSDKIREWLNEGILDNATLVDMLLVGLPDNAFSDLVIEIGMQLDEE